jgi:hypothetical protein
MTRVSGPGLLTGATLVEAVEGATACGLAGGKVGVAALTSACAVADADADDDADGDGEEKALPLTLLGATVMGEWSYTATFEHAHDSRFWGSVMLASCAGVFITYIVFLCTTVNGPLVTSVTGNAKDIVQTLLGAVLFNDFVPTAQNVLGIANKLHIYLNIFVDRRRIDIYVNFFRANRE